MYPSESVVIAMFESYLSMRKSTWNLTDEDGRLVAPEKDSDPAHKIDTCKAILQKVNGQVLITPDWIKIVSDLHSLEKSEQKHLDNLWAIRRWFGSRLLLETLKAIRSYILTELQKNPQYDAHIKMLEKAKSDAGMLYTSRSNLKDTHKPEEIALAAENYAAATDALKPFDLGAIKYDKQDHLHYFETHISKNDPQSRIDALNEKSFADFVKNAMILKRTTVLCSKLLESSKPVAAKKAVPASKNIPISTQSDKISKSANVQSLEEAAAKSSNPVVSNQPKPRRSNRIRSKESNSNTDKKPAQSPLQANSVLRSPPTSNRTRRRSRANYAQTEDSPKSSSQYRKY